MLVPLPIELWIFSLVRAPGDNLPFILSIIGVGMIVISGWLGVELVYVRGAAVKEAPDQSV